MHYYIDGYNLMFRILNTHDDLSVKRQQLIEDIAAKAALLELNLTLVFDSQYHPSESTRSHFGKIEILFTDAGETADERILEEIKQERIPLKITVVTSDKKLAWFARRCAAETETAEFFITWLNKRFRNRLRQQKSFKEKKIVVEKKPQKKNKPLSSDAPEQCTDFYLEAFEARFKKIEEQMPKRSPVAELKKQKKKDPFEEPKEASKEAKQEPKPAAKEEKQEPKPVEVPKVEAPPPAAVEESLKEKIPPPSPPTGPQKPKPGAKPVSKDKSAKSKTIGERKGWIKMR